MEGEAGETWKIWLRWGFTQETAGRELESEGVGRELTLPPWASIFLGFEAGIRGPIGPPQAVSGVGGGSGRERREEGGHPADTLQGREWRLSRWKFRRSLPRANCTPVQDKNSPSSHHRPPPTSQSQVRHLQPGGPIPDDKYPLTSPTAPNGRLLPLSTQAGH